MSKVDFKAWKTSNMLVTHPIVQSEISILEYKIEQRDQRIAELENLLTEVREEHTPSELIYNGAPLGCNLCGANDGYRWPCTTRLIVDEVNTNGRGTQTPAR